MRRTLSVLAAASFLLATLASCTRDPTQTGGCLNGQAGCRVSSPCTALEFACAGTGALEVRKLDGVTRPTGGWSAQAAKDDVLLSNGQVRVVISAIGHQYHLAPNGGSIIDLSTGADANDAMNEIYQASGLLPEDAVRYTELVELDERPERVAVQVNGHLDGRPDIRVHTLYELRPCEPGVRVRTELVNESPDAHMFFAGDAYFWGNHTAPWPFSPTPNAGFLHPPVRLTALNDAYRQFPYFGASSHSAMPGGSPNIAYTTVACNEKNLEGFHSIAITAATGPRSIVGPRDFTVFERFIGAVPGDDVQDASDLALELRKQLFDEEYVTLSGTVVKTGGSVGEEREASVLISEGAASTAVEQRKPITQVVPRADGTWTARAPRGKAYLAEVVAFGRIRASVDVPVVNADTTVPALTVPATTHLSVSVRNASGGAPVYAEVVVVPTNEATREATEGSFHGVYSDCAPFLGSSAGPSPSCNRALVSPDAPLELELPSGKYDVYAFKSPFWSIDFVTVDASGADLDLTGAASLEITEVVAPPASWQADMHIHGGASHDSEMPDDERARTFAAAELDVVIATDHDVVYDYAPAIAQLGLSDQIHSIVGVESTNWIPFFKLPGYPYPLTLGHSNFWPLRYDPAQPRNGGPFDEYKEPGAIYDEVESRGMFTATNHIVQLNHPYASAELGRDLGFAKALFFDATRDLPTTDDQSGNWVFVRKPNGKRSNAGHHAQEVMNGTKNGSLLPNRAFWFYLLNQGQLKTGTANSDSHYLVDSTVGMPRTLVQNTSGGWDVEAFNGALRAGQAMGTNGPMIYAAIERDGGGLAGYGLAPVKPAADADLNVIITAAPWVHVEEIRFIVNGQVAKTIHSANINNPDSPLGTSGALRYAGSVPLAELLDGVTGDAWIVVEAGRKLMLYGDLGGAIDGSPDGIPDTTDNNGDGQVNGADLEVEGGRMRNPAAPADPAAPEFHYARLNQGGYPYAFTNPFVLDRDGNGNFDAPGVGGGRP